MKGNLILVISLIAYISSTLTPMDKKELADSLLSEIKNVNRVSTFLQDNMHNFRSYATIEIGEFNDINVIRNKMNSMGASQTVIKQLENIFTQKKGSVINGFFRDDINSFKSQREAELKKINERRKECWNKMGEPGAGRAHAQYRCFIDYAYKYTFEPQNLKVEYIFIIARIKDGAFQAIIANGYTTASPNKVYVMETMGENCKNQFQGVNEPKDFDNMRNILISRTLTKINSKYFDEIDKINKEIYQEKDSSEGTPDQKKINYLENLRKTINPSKSIDNTMELLIRNIKSEADEIHMSTFTVDKLSTITKKYGFPKKLEEYLEPLIFQKQGNSFSFPIYDIPTNQIPTYFALTKYIGIFVKDDSTVFFVFIKTKVRGDAAYRVTIPHTRLDCRGYQCKFTCTQKQYGFTNVELEKVQGILDSFSSDSLYQKLDSLLKSQTLLYQSVPMRVGDFRAVINSDGTIKINNVKTRAQTQNLGISSDTRYSPYTVQLEDNGKLSIVNKYYETTSLLFSGGKGTGPYTLSISDDGKLVLLDKNKSQVYKS